MEPSNRRRSSRFQGQGSSRFTLATSKWMAPGSVTSFQNGDQKLGKLPISGSSASEQSPSTLSPPYWQHQRASSQSSVDSTICSPAISLEDHTQTRDGTSATLWAKDITIEDYVIVRGGSTGIGAYVVWNCTVQTLDVGLPIFPLQSLAR
jgi:hypothetical protein